MKNDQLSNLLFCSKFTSNLRERERSLKEGDRKRATGMKNEK
jgi:hypothetical protein